jgi:hypothetical protein
VFTGCQPQIRHQLARIIKPAEVSDLSNHRDGDNESHALHRLDGFHDRRKAPAGQQVCDLAGEFFDPSLSIANGINIILKNDLLSRVIKAHSRQPAPVGDRPPLLSRINPSMTQQEPLEMLARLT